MSSGVDDDAAAPPAAAPARGLFELLVGPMYSSKTGMLLAEGHRHELAGRRVLYATSARDSGRYTDGGTEIVTHVAHGVQARVPAVSVPAHAALHDVLCTPGPEYALRPEYARVEVVLVDEGQFIVDMVGSVRVLCDTLGMHVVCAMLQATFAREPWPELGALVATADRVHHLHAVCRRCRGARPAAHSTRLCAATTTGVVHVGGADVYEARCRRCWTPAPPAV